MISVPNNTPKTVSFTQTVDNNTTDIAKSQIGKLALAETLALGEKENADFHLAKATETLRLAEIAYRESISKSVWNKEELRKAYNNAIAGYRLADQKAQKAAEELTLAKNALAGTRAVANGEILKREFSDDKRQELASKGKAMPDGSYPIETKADLANAIQSYGRASDPKAVKAHIITQAKALGASDDLPEDWKDAESLSTAVPTTKSVLRKDASMSMTDYPVDPSMGIPVMAGQTDDDASAPYDKILCPDCLGFDGNEGCPTCDGVQFIAVMKEAPRTANPFATDELLTRQFQKSSAYQNYIMKGGPGSGAQVGHSFNGNQWTGGMRSFTRGEMAGRREGWKQTLKRYEGAHDQHLAAGRQASADARALEQAGRLREAADKHEEANGHLMKAHGALKGMQNVMQRETDNGSHGASQDQVAGYAGRASSIRAEANAAADNVARLNPLADAQNLARA